MTLFVASVTGPEEAEIALANGADVLEVAEPGSPAPRLDTVRATVAHVAGRRPVIAAAAGAGDPQALAAAVLELGDSGIDFAKIGFPPGEGRSDCIRGLASLKERVALVGVMFADAGADDHLLPLMADAGFAGAVLDTTHKGAPHLLDYRSIAALKTFVVACRANRLLAGLAGSLEAPDVPRLLLIEPDYLGFRRALCKGGRAAGVDPACVSLIRGLIPLDARSVAHAEPAPSEGHPWISRLRGLGPAWTERDGPTDRVIVHDFVLPVPIGAYARERDRLQNVRFNVDVRVPRLDHAVEDMRDVFSYDVVTDGIRMIIAHERIAFIETLAERVAALVLQHPLAVSVTVRVEKLDVVPGAVGVEIVREKPRTPR